MRQAYYWMWLSPPGYAYLAVANISPHYNNAYLVILDVSDPTNPFRTSSFRLGVDYLPTQMGLTIAENYVYTVWEEGLTIRDVSNPVTPTLVSDYETVTSAADIVLTDELALLANGISGLRLIDISNPMTLTEVGAYQTIGFAKEVIEQEDYIYVADQGESKGDYSSVNGGLKVIGNSTATDPLLMGFHQIEDRVSFPAGGLGLAVAEDYAYLAIGTFDYYGGLSYSGLEVLSISQPTIPSQLGYYDTGLEYGSYRLFWLQVTVADDYAYLAVPENGLHILDVSTPTKPIKVALVEMSGAWDVTIAEDYAYLLGDELRILDISGPTNPTEVASYDITGEAITIAGGYAYIVDDLTGLRIVDISSPSAPNEVGALEMAGAAQDVAISGNLAFVASGEAGVRAIDVSVPTAPIEVGSYDTPGNASSLSVREPYLYVADGKGGLFVFEFGPSHELFLPTIAR